MDFNLVPNTWLFDLCDWNNCKTNSEEIHMHNKALYNINKCADFILDKCSTFDMFMRSEMTSSQSTFVSTKYYTAPKSLPKSILAPNRTQYDLSLYGHFSVLRRPLILKDEYEYEQYEMNRLMQANKFWLDKGPSYSTESMFLNDKEFLCSKVPESHLCSIAFWHTIWNENILTLVAMTTKSHQYVAPYLPEIGLN